MLVWRCSFYNESRRDREICTVPFIHWQKHIVRMAQWEQIERLHWSQLSTSLRVQWAANYKDLLSILWYNFICISKQSTNERTIRIKYRTFENVQIMWRTVCAIFRHFENWFFCVCVTNNRTFFCFSMRIWLNKIIASRKKDSFDIVIPHAQVPPVSFLSFFPFYCVWFFRELNLIQVHM